MEFKILKISELEPFIIREIRQDIVEKLKERIEKDGYNNSRPLSVVEKDGKYSIADGNHRYHAIKDNNIDVPCMVYDDDVYSLAVRMNQDEDTYAKMDLFDWLDIINNMKSEGYTLKKIGKIIGWSEDLLKRYSQLINKVSDDILEQLKNIQRESVTKEVTPVTFSEYMLRDSGIYCLKEVTISDDEIINYQQKFIDQYIAGKYRWDNLQAIKRMTAKLKQQQEFIEIAKEKLSNEENLTDIIELIENGNFKNEGQLLSKINDLNSKAANKLICGDSLIELEGLDDNIIDVVITDPPYGIEYSSNRSKYDDHVTKEGIRNDELDEALTLLDKTCEILKRKSKADSHFYFFTSWKVYHEFKLIIDKYFDIKNMIVWDKGNHTMGDLEYVWANKHELIIFATKGSRKLNKRKQDIININRLSSSNMIHPTQKPVELILQLLEASAQKADTICDPFMGSGSTIKAIRQHGELNYIGIEIDKNYFERAKGFINE